MRSIFAHAANTEVTGILQARNPEVMRSKKRGLYRKYSAEQKPGSKKQRMSFALFFAQVLHRDAHTKSIVNVDTVPLAIQFVVDAGVPYFFISRCPLTQLEIIAIAIATGNRGCFFVLRPPSLPSS